MKSKFQMWAVKTRGLRFIICRTQAVLDGVLTKLGKQMGMVRAYFHSPNRAQRKQFVLYCRNEQYITWQRRAVALGFPNVQKYLKFLIYMDNEMNILERGEDFLGESPYNYTKPYL